MNQYKLDWYLASQLVGETLVNQMVHDQNRVQDSHPHHRNQFNKTMDSVTSTLARGAVTWAVPEIAKHLAKNQLKGKLGKIGRVTGRVGLRAVPLLGAAMMIHDVKSLYKFLTS